MVAKLVPIAFKCMLDSGCMCASLASVAAIFINCKCPLKEHCCHAVHLVFKGCDFHVQVDKISFAMRFTLS